MSFFYISPLTYFGILKPRQYGMLDQGCWETAVRDMQALPFV
jgi:hypothetical protein